MLQPLRRRSCICAGTLTDLRIFLPGPRRSRIWREAGYRLMQEVKFRLVNPNPRAAADQAPDTVFDGTYHFMLRAAKGCERE